MYVCVCVCVCVCVQACLLAYMHACVCTCGDAAKEPGCERSAELTIGAKVVIDFIVHGVHFANVCGSAQRCVTLTMHLWGGGGSECGRKVIANEEEVRAPGSYQEVRTPPHGYTDTEWCWPGLTSTLSTVKTPTHPHTIVSNTTALLAQTSAGKLAL
jgi:hypothetical protein